MSEVIEAIAEPLPASDIATTPAPQIIEIPAAEPVSGELLFHAHLDAALAPLDSDSTDEQFAHARDLLDLLKQWTKQRETELETAMLERVTEKGDLNLDPIRYYAGNEKETKCRDIQKAVVRLLNLALERSEGDLDAAVEKLADVLSTNAVKYGAARKWLAEVGAAEVFDELFEVTEKTVLKEGKPSRNGKTLQKVDTRWIR